MAELTQLHVTLADFHGLIADFHNAISGMESAIHGFRDTAAGSVADRDRTVRDAVAEGANKATSGLTEHLTRLRSVLTALQRGQAVGDAGRIHPQHHVPGQPIPAGATVTVDRGDPSVAADDTGSGVTGTPERHEIHERRDADATAEREGKPKSTATESQSKPPVGK